MQNPLRFLGFTQRSMEVAGMPGWLLWLVLGVGAAFGILKIVGVL